MNTVAVWLELIGTPERARKLRARLPWLQVPKVVDPEFGPEPPQCPTTVLFGMRGSQRVYASRRLQPALDAWDTGELDSADLRRFCLWIEQGKYNGPTYQA